MITTLRLAVETSGLVTDRNSKMPGSSFPTDPLACRRGSILADIEGSTCSKCYAIRLAKYRANVAHGWKRNQTAINDTPREAWIDGMVFQITRAADRSGQRFHRWFDAGDLHSVENLDRIAAVCKRTTTIKHWLPTREIGIVRAWTKDHDVPRNLTIRLSSTMIDAPPLTKAARAMGRGIACSTVHHKTDPVGHACPAHDQGNQCGECRACWDRRVRNVSYPKH